MLTQASREYPEAGGDLVELARTGKLDATDLAKIAWSLAGNENLLVTRSSEYTQYVKSEVYTTERAPQTWSDGQIDRQLALIDDLLRTTADPAAEKALTDAREKLLTWRSKPMVAGKRKG